MLFAVFPENGGKALRGQDGQVVRPEQVEEQLIPAAHRAVLRQAGDTHELPGSLPLAQELLFLSIHCYDHSFPLHSKAQKGYETGVPLSQLNEIC